MKVFQIYFDDSQKGGLDYLPYRNDDCTIFFENSVIKSLLQAGAHQGCDYFGVVSHQLRNKLAYTREAWTGELANGSTRTFTPEDFEAEVLRQRPDAMSFLSQAPHDPITCAEGFHPGFSHYFQRIMGAIGYDWRPMRLDHVFYFNYFVATPAVYERYVTEMLAPAMAAMNTMPELMQNSGYARQLPLNLRTRFGISHYPYHPFLCERFFSFFAHVNQLKCSHY
jgi:hypothetical protein